MLIKIQAFVFHGHRVTVATASDVVNRSSPKGVSGLAGLAPIPRGITLPPPFPPLIHVFAPGPTSLGDQGIDDPLRFRGCGVFPSFPFFSGSPSGIIRR